MFPTAQSHMATARQRADTTTVTSWSPLVSEHARRDGASTGHYGKHCREVVWKVLPALGCTPVVITVEVDKRVLHSPEVRVTCSGVENGQEVLFPLPSLSNSLAITTRESLQEDFSYCVPFRVLTQGIGATDIYEVGVTRAGETRWFAATILAQREDGLLDVVAQVPVQCGQLHDLRLPAVRAEDVRERTTRRSLKLVERSLVLHVPKLDPLAATLKVDGVGEDIAVGNVAWPYVFPGAAWMRGPRVSLRVSQDRQCVSADVGHRELSCFLSGEIKAKSTEHATEQRSWTLNLGAQAQHTITLKRTCRSGVAGKVLALSIDGMPFVEGSAKDLACDGAWECNFRLVGERVLDCEVFETDEKGQTLASQAHVELPKAYSYRCSVRLSETSQKDSLRLAKLVVDGIPFEQLRPARQETEQRISMASDALELSYGIVLPHHVKKEAPSMIPSYAEITDAFQGMFPGIFVSTPA